MSAKRIDQMSIADFDRAFPDEAACASFLQQQRWGDGVRCPRCGSTEVRARHEAVRVRWECPNCKDDDGKHRRFSVRTGTIFENTPLPLRTWFSAIHLILISRKVLGPIEIQKLLGIDSHQAAWHMCRRIRLALQDYEFRQMMALPPIAPLGSNDSAGKIESDSPRIVA